MSALSLADRAVIVTGAARGVGKGIANALLDRGAAVLLVDLHKDNLTATAAEFASAGTPSSRWSSISARRTVHS